MSSSSDATSLDTTIKYPQPEKRALDTVSAECSKEKRIKRVTVDNTESKIIVNTKGVWVQFHRNTLMMEDKHIIENSLRLTDKHISFANCLILHHIGGLVRHYSKPDTIVFHHRAFKLFFASNLNIGLWLLIYKAVSAAP